MPNRIQNILLVSSLYDSFILAQDGQLNEVILSEYLQLNLHNTPGLKRVSTGTEALELAMGPRRWDLIITSMHVGDMNAPDLARRVNEAGLATPVVLLAYDYRELREFVDRHDTSDLAGAFLWQGDVRILLAVVKHVEDRMNVAHDTGQLGVQAIIVIEDSIRYYSSFLPVIYTEVMNQSHHLLPEGMNLSHKLMRIEARPKILLCNTYEEAWAHFSTYQKNILGVIADIEFPQNGRLAPDAGVRFAQAVHEAQPDVPVMLQSSDPANESLARSVGASFLVKESPVLLQQLRRFMVDNFGFGDFVFRRPDGTEVGRATDLRSLEALLRVAPPESVAYHAQRNHFSKWLKARTEFALAHSLRPRRVEDYPSIEHLRTDLVQAIQAYREQRDRSVVADFDRASFDGASSFSRIGGGSFGGKARGLAFMNLLIDDAGIRDEFPDTRIVVPPFVVVSTDVFEDFLDRNQLRDLAINAVDDGEVLQRFLRAEFPPGAAKDLARFVDRIHYPLAVRSSSLLEDSHYRPFAGVYATYMLANNHAGGEVRLERLVTAVKRVFASAFSQQAKAYLANTPYRLEEEKMAVILQQVVGIGHRDRFYPDLAGVARSHNFYPVPPMTADAGIAAVALGLGDTVVNGRVCVRFCPRYPKHLVQFSSVRDALQNSQRSFFGLQLGTPADGTGSEGEFELREFGLDAAEDDGSLELVGSTWSAENDAIYDGVSRSGVRLVSFAPILKHEMFPLSAILERLLAIATEGTSSAVEIEFAANLSTPRGTPREFGFLQLRPLAVSVESASVEFGQIADQDVVCRSASVLGNGRVDDLRDVIVVDVERFERARSQEVAREVGLINAELVRDRRPFLLIGVGRWGSKEPLLGIPVTWNQISGARVIVEAGFRDFRVTPSQGTHFFQNITAASLGYFTVNPEVGEGFVDWQWLAAQPAVSETAFVRHLRLASPVIVKMHGRNNRGVILKPTRQG